MLCQFTFQNFKSYKEETVFDFQAAALPEFKEHLITSEKGGSPLLPVSVVYGPNAGGKSNLLKALSALICTVVKPVHELKKSRNWFIAQQSISPAPYAFAQECAAEPTRFEVYFRTQENEFRYVLALLDDAVASEGLYRRSIGGKRTAMIFERAGAKIILGASIRSPGVNTGVNPKLPYLSFLAINYDLPVIAEAQGWFESCIIRNYANAVSDHKIFIPKEEKRKAEILRLLNDMGIEISDFRFDPDEKQFFLQRTIGGQVYELDFIEESEGTKKLCSVLPLLQIALAEGRLFIADELDAKLHPKLLRYILLLFKNKEINRNGAQLLFTSHDLSNMKNDLFRRDEIWFAACNEKRESELYSLYDIRREDHQRVKNTAAYDKQYLEGRYGADPYLKNMLNWGE